MSGRVKRGFFNDDGLWIQYWQTQGDPVEERTEPPEYAFDIILARSKLTQKQLFVIECRYGFRGPEMSLDEIAALMGVTKQAVHRLIERALANLRKGLTKSPMGAYKGLISDRSSNGESVELQLDSVDHPPPQAA